MAKESCKRLLKQWSRLGRCYLQVPPSKQMKSQRRKPECKVGQLQVALTREKANTGAAIAVVFGFVSWELSQGIQSIPESSLQYANDDGLRLAKSLRGALLVLGYSSAILSASASVGILFLGRQLGSGSKGNQ